MLLPLGEGEGSFLLSILEVPDVFLLVGRKREKSDGIGGFIDGRRGGNGGQLGVEGLLAEKQREIELASRDNKTMGSFVIQMPELRMCTCSRFGFQSGRGGGKAHVTMDAEDA